MSIRSTLFCHSKRSEESEFILEGLPARTAERFRSRSPGAARGQREYLNLGRLILRLVGQASLPVDDARALARATAEK
jgi:hypothetical protein